MKDIRISNRLKERSSPVHSQAIYLTGFSSQHFSCLPLHISLISRNPEARRALKECFIEASSNLNDQDLFIDADLG